MLRSLTDVEIEALAALPGVRRVAVENFLGSLELCKTRWGAEINLQNDARAYRWNDATKRAILAGIVVAAGAQKLA